MESAIIPVNFIYFTHGVEYTDGDICGKDESTTMQEVTTMRDKTITLHKHDDLRESDAPERW